MSNLIYWVWLQAALGPGSRKALPLARALGSPAAVFDADDAARRDTRLLSQRDLERLRQTPLDDADRILRDCERLGLQIITPQSPSYPERLRQIADPPVALYLQGRLPRIDDEVCLALVGTRRATSYGQEAALRLAMRLSRAGALIVSGGAPGVDSAAHRGALCAGRPTVAVLGCGIDYPYRPENAVDRRAIARQGALLSEYPPGTPPTSYSFPCRNRLISGLSLGTVVIEAGEKSGSLITARLATEQGRDLFAVPGNVMSTSYTGTNRLLRDGAKPVYSALDVLEEYGDRFGGKLTLAGSGVLIGEHDPDDPPEVETSVPSEDPGEQAPPSAVRRPARKANAPSPPPPPTRPDPPERLTGPALAVYKAFGEEIASVDNLVERSGHLPGEVLRALTELELLGCVESTVGGRYRLCSSADHTQPSR